MKHRYSPQPIEAYFLPGTESCELRAISKMEYSLEVWNLMWLSLPPVDTLLGSTAKGYWRNYQSWPAMVGAVVADASNDEALREALSRPPAQFQSWFINQRDYTIFDTWDVAGPSWVETVVERADLSAMSRLSQKPFIFAKDSVLRIDYRNAA
jgi:hypothetical protein